MESFTGSSPSEQIAEALILLMGLVPSFFGITTKQRLLPGYVGEIPPVTSTRKILAPCLKLMLTQVTSRGRK